MSLLIITVFFNRVNEVNPSVRSLIESAPDNSILLLVDDGSTEKTLDELNKFVNEPRVKIVSQENKGFSKTLSTLIPKYVNMYKPEFLAIHGAGDLCKKTKFTKQLEYLNNNKNIVALGCGHETKSMASGSIIEKVDGLVIASKDFLHKKPPFTHGTVIYRTKEFMAVGGYNELFKFSQDWDLYFRLIELGKIVRYPEVLYTKYIFSDGVSFKPEKKVEQIKFNKIIFSRKHSQEVYERHLTNLRDMDINEIFTNNEIMNECIRAQTTLILRGEFKFAKEFIEIIDNDKKYLFNKIINISLSVLIFLKFPSKIFALFSRGASKLRA